MDWDRSTSQESQKGGKSALREKWENAFSGKQLDSVIVLSCSKGAERDWRRKVLAPGEKVLLKGKRAQIFSKGLARIRRVIIGILPYVKITNLHRDANSATIFYSDTLSLMGSPAKSRSKVVGKDQLPSWRSLYSWVACPKTPCLRKSLVHGKAEKWDQIARSHSPRAHGTTWTNREKKGPSQGIIQMCEPQERNPCAPKFEERTLEETLQQERCARREAWDLAKNVF